MKKAARRFEEGGAPASAKVRLLEPSLESLDALCCDSIAVGVTTDTRPLVGAAGYLDWRLCGRISRMLQAGVATGAAGEKVLLPTLGRLGATRIFLFGWGPERSVFDQAQQRLSWMVDVLDEADVRSVAVALPEPVDALLPLVDEHLARRLGKRLVGVFAGDPLRAS